MQQRGLNNNDVVIDGKGRRFSITGTRKKSKNRQNHPESHEFIYWPSAVKRMC